MYKYITYFYNKIIITTISITELYFKILGNNNTNISSYLEPFYE